MRKIILTMLLAIVSSSAMAEWVEIDVTYDGTYIIYVDPSTISRAGNKVKMWDLLDYKTAQKLEGKSYLSIKGQSEYDCKENKTRMLYRTIHSENVGEGEVVDAGIKPHDWEPVVPDSIGGVLLEFACKKR